MVTTMTPSKLAKLSELDLWVNDVRKGETVYRYACYKDENGKWIAELCMNFKNTFTRDLTPAALCKLLNSVALVESKKPGIAVSYDMWSKAKNNHGKVYRITPRTTKRKTTNARVPRARMPRMW